MVLNANPHLQQTASLHGPQEDLEGVLGSGAHQLAADIYSQGGELRRARRCEGPEVAVPANTEELWFLCATSRRSCENPAATSPVQVEGPDGAVQRGADDDEAAGGEGHAGDAAGVLGERDEAQAAAGVPRLHLWRQKQPGERRLRLLHAAAAGGTYFAVVPARHDVLPVRRVRQRRHVVEVALLLEDVRLTLPLPH